MSQEVRDAVARLEGWTKNAAGHWVNAKGVERRKCPIPDSIDACAKAWDRHARNTEGQGWQWAKRYDPDTYVWRWEAWSPGGRVYPVQMSINPDDAASELRDRWELLGLVLKARGVV